MTTVASSPTQTTQRPISTQSGVPVSDVKNHHRLMDSKAGDSKPGDKSGDHGGKPPRDFGCGSPDYNRDGHISEHEAKVYDSELRAETAAKREETRREVDLYREDARTKVSMYRERSANYRAELTARTEQIKSQNDNKIHKLFGISPFHDSPAKPEKP